MRRLVYCFLLPLLGFATLTGCADEEKLTPPEVLFDGSLSVGGLPVSADYDTTVKVKNLGEERLVISGITAQDTGLIKILLQVPKSIEGGDSLAIRVRIHAGRSDRFTDTITVMTNDEEHPVIEIPVVLTTRSYELAQDGWTKFEAGNFAGALADFNAAVALDSHYGDALTGQGWSLMKTDQLASAITAFAAAIAEGAGNDAHAGKAFAELNSENHANAVADVNAVVTITGNIASSYTFTHDNTITQTDLLWIKARAHYLLGQFAEAQTAVNVLAPSNTLDPQSASYVTDLAALIESLRGTV